MRGELGDFLADAGAVVGGATVLGATLGFIAGSLVQDVRPETNPEEWRASAAWRAACSASESSCSSVKLVV
jgi:hypothetical protein